MTLTGKCIITTGEADSARVSGVDVRWRSEPALPEAAKAVRIMLSDSPATALEAIDTVGFWASTMVVMTTDGAESSIAALSAAAARPAQTKLTLEGSPVKPAAAHGGALSTSGPEPRSNPGATGAAPSGWDALIAAADATAATAGVSSLKQPGTAVPRHALAAGLLVKSDQPSDDGAAGKHAPVALGPAVRSHRTIQVRTF